MVFCSFLTVVIFFRSHNSVEIKVFLTFLPVDGRIRLNNYGSGSRRPNNLQILSFAAKEIESLLAIFSDGFFCSSCRVVYTASSSHPAISKRFFQKNFYKKINFATEFERLLC
jgi:hypothetical protein